MQTLKVLKNAKRWITIDRHPILWPMVNFFIKMQWFQNHGKFKKGDKVKYNFFARVVIASVIKPKDKVYTFSHYEPWSKKLENCVLEEDSGCDVFWLRKLYPWERWGQNILLSTAPIISTTIDRITKSQVE